MRVGELNVYRLQECLDALIATVLESKSKEILCESCGYFLFSDAF